MRVRSNIEASEQPDWIKSFFSRVVPVGLAIIGVITTVATVPQVRDAQASSGWPTAQGLVTKAEIRETKVPGSRATYRAEVKYRYEVDGKSYSSTVIRNPARGTRHRSDAEALVQRFPQGGTVEVYYKPSDPENALLIPGLHFLIVLMPLIGVVMIVGGGAMWKFWPRPGA